VSAVGVISRPVINMDIRRSPDPQALAYAAANFIAARIAVVIAERGSCHLALAGGGTPQAAYLLMREMNIDWSRLHIWFGDERCLPVGHAERNDTMARLALLGHTPLPAVQLHPIPTELGPEAAADIYSDQLGTIEQLDIVLLGLGEDGHTASLFPGNAALELDTAAVPVFGAPKPPSQRVSLSLNAIRQAGERIVLVAGSGKRGSLARILAGVPLPAAMIGEALWFVDEATISP
jgi:6-phosphogluconolactonase